MAFSNFGNAAAPNISQGPALPEVHTEGLGFLSLAPNAKLRLVTPWSPPPNPNASLMSIASRRGLVAAAGPDAVVVASTESVRKALDAPADGDAEIQSFTPQLKLPLSIRICQLAFSSDEAYLALSAEQGGGLAVYEVNAFQQGTTQPAFEIPTNGESLRALVPNPSQEKAELCAVVTNGGKLLVASFRERDFISGGDSRVLKEQVSCAAWSNKGKQLVAGLGDGAMCQLTPEGAVKAEIPRPPGLDSSYYVSSVVWLENDLFLVFHVGTTNGPQTKCHLITRKGTSFQFQTLNDPVEPYTPEITPHHSVVRLRDFPPNLQDLFILASNATPDTGLIGRSKTALAPNGPVNVFANIELADDSKRATLPMSEDPESLDSPAAVGVALDLSSREKVYKPIPSDELEQSPGPLPGYWVLNEQGILSAWWVVYSESIRGGTTYPGLAVVEANTTESASPLSHPTAQSVSAGVLNSSPFGSQAAQTTFGGPSALGAKSSPWGAPSASTNGTGGATFGSSALGGGGAPALKPAFGSSTFGAPSLSSPRPAFGQSTGLGAKASPWGAGGASLARPAFGQTGFANASNATTGPFASAASSVATGGGGFSSFASQGGFAALGATSNGDKPNIFASTKLGSIDAAMDTDNNTSFPPPSSKPNDIANNPFGSQSSPFKLTSSFKPDTNVYDDDSKRSPGAEKSFFGSGFSAAINESPKPVGSTFGGGQTVFGEPTNNTNPVSTTPTATPSTNKFINRAPSLSVSNGPFSPPSMSSGGTFGQVSPKVSMVGSPQAHQAASDVPLAPDSTNKADTSLQSTAEDLPLPPDSPEIEKDTDTTTKKPAISSAAPLPPDPVKNKAAYSAPLPPLPVENAKPASINDVPLPPDPVSNKKAYASKLPPLPGASTQLETPGKEPPMAHENKLAPSPIVRSAFTAGPGFKFPTEMPPVSDSDDDGLAEEGSEDGSEGSGVDVAKDLSPSSTGTTNRTPGYTPQGSFVEGSDRTISTMSRPVADRRGFLFVQDIPVFPQPDVVSPRSPSPVRSAIPPRTVGYDQPRVSSVSGVASRILASSKRQPQSRLNSSIVSRDAALENAVMEQQRKARAKKQAEEAQLLMDEEDDAAQKIMRKAIEPTLDLHEFIAHSGVVPLAGDNVPAQVEAVYRDINSMIDTLGLNARSLQAWIDGHHEFSSGGRSKQDLASPNDWTLADTEQLSYIVDRVLADALDEARVTEVEDKVAQVHDIQRELSRDLAKEAEIRKIISSRLDPEQTTAHQALPLSAEQAAQQSDLRRQLSRFQTLLAQAEEDLTMLKAKIVSANSANGKGGPVPTVEAIVRTINKMTSMVEKRSGDIDVLENQMRKMRLGSTGPGASREGSPFTTPNAKRTLGSSIFSPDRSIREATPMRASIFRHSLTSSTPGTDAFRTTPRKKINGFVDAEKKAVKEKRERRAVVLGNLRSSIAAKGPTVIPMGDIA
ncbi:hypothetical protein GGR50DRAFT_659147 [Xylaria sp. CBS 124048]|nr:hypothetical protein GGR50DRAFT_659147 [Xylaria sp. CBS 124048]